MEGSYRTPNYAAKSRVEPAPPRFSASLIRRGLLVLTLFVLASASFVGTEVSLVSFVEGIPSMLSLVSEMWPPDFSRLGSVSLSMLTTLQIAFAGTFVGLGVSLLLGVLGSRSQGPAAWLRHLVVVGLAGVRTVPELLWALIFVVAVGPGSFAGVLAICMDTLGFAGRFFAEAFDEIDPKPQEALRVHGASQLLVLSGAAIPLALPSLIHTSLYSLERALRASVVLGIVGAGGIGIELKAKMDLFEYRQASAIILCILVVVVAVEVLGTLVRNRIQGQKKFRNRTSRLLGNTKTITILFEQIQSKGTATDVATANSCRHDGRFGYELLSARGHALYHQPCRNEFL